MSGGTLKRADLLSAFTGLIGVIIIDSNQRLVYLNGLGKAWLKNINIEETTFIEKLTVHHQNYSVATSKFSFDSFHFEVKDALIEGSKVKVYYFTALEGNSSSDVSPDSDNRKKLEKTSEELIIDLQMKRLLIDRKEYELGLLRSLIDEISGSQELQTITTKFIQFCANHFLFSQAFYIDLRPGEDIRIGSIYPDRGRSNIDTKWEFVQIFLHNHKKCISNLQGLWSLNKSEAMHFLRQFENYPIGDVLTYPLNINGKEIGSFLFATQEGHHGFTLDGLDLLSDLIEIIKPIINNSLLLELSLTDELSGLKNRRMFDIAFKAEIESAKKANSPLSLIIIDIDHFKKINDTYGHSVGDLAIKHLAKAIRTSIRQSDGSFRYGGEEFAIIIRGDIKIAETAARRIESTLRNSVLTTNEADQLPFTISQGLSQYSNTWSDGQFFELTDQALYQSKHNGRNQYTIVPQPKANEQAS